MSSHRDAPYWVHSDPTLEAEAQQGVACPVPDCESLAVDGSKLCTSHRATAVEAFSDLPGLYARLAGCLAPYKSPQAPKGGGGHTTEAPDVLNPPVFEVRKDIERKFFEWSAYTAVEREVSMPGPSVKSMAAFLERHADWLCNDRLAAKPVGAWTSYLLGEAIRLVNRSRSRGLFLGLCPKVEVTVTEDVRVDYDGRAHRTKTRTESPPCGGPIRFDQEEQRACRDMGIVYQVTCPRCGAANSWLAWHKQIVGDTEPPNLLPAVPLAAILADSLAPELAAAGRKITPSTIGKWKWEGDIQPTACDLRSKRDLFDRTVVEAFARNRLKLNPESRTA